MRKEGVDERIVRIVERHVGAGLTEEDAVYLGLPPKDYIPETREEKIVCHADNLIGNRTRITIHDAIRTAEERWSPGGLERLIRMHFEVFRPEIVLVDRQMCEEGALDGIIGGRATAALTTAGTALADPASIRPIAAAARACAP